MLKKSTKSMMKSSKILFNVLAGKRYKMFLLVLSVCFAFFQALSFDLVIDSDFIINITLSFFVAIAFYFLTYGLGSLMKYISDKLYKNEVEYFLFAPQLLFIGLFFVINIEAILLPNWEAYSSPFNPLLVLLAAYYALGDIAYQKKTFASFRKSNDAEHIFTDADFKKATFTIILIVVIINLLQAYNAYRLKTGLYYESLSAIQNSEEVRELLNGSYQVSLYIKGDYSKENSNLIYNLKSNGEIAIVNVKGKYSDDRWEIKKLLVETPNKILTLIEID